MEPGTHFTYVDDYWPGIIIRRMMSTLLTYPLIVLGAAGLITWILELIIHAAPSL